MKEENRQNNEKMVSSCRHDSGDDHALEQRAIQKRMRLIKNKILVLSGKGGVGKSTVAANLADRKSVV